MEITKLQVINKQLVVDIEGEMTEQTVGIRIGGDVSMYAGNSFVHDLDQIIGKKNILIFSMNKFDLESGQYGSMALHPDLQHTTLFFEDDFTEYVLTTKERRIALNVKHKQIEIDRKTIRLVLDEAYDDVKLDIQTRKRNNGALLSGNTVDGRVWTFEWEDWLTQLFAQQTMRRSDIYVILKNENGSKRVRLKANAQDKASALVVDTDSVPTLYQQGIQAYVTQDGYWSLIKNSLHKIRRERLAIKTTVNALSREGDAFKITAVLKGNLPDDFQIQEGLLVLRNRLNYEEKSVQVEVIEQTEKQIDLIMLVDVHEPLSPYYWDVYVRVLANEEQFILQIDRAANQVKQYVYQHPYNREVHIGQNAIFYPYITSGQGNIAFETRPLETFETPSNLRQERIAYWVAKLLTPYFMIRKPWIIYEKNVMGAHDNGFHFFKYLYEQKKSVPAYYVIDPTSPEYKNLANMKDRVIDFMSFKYFLYLYGAKLLISSDTKYHVYNMHRRDSLIGRALEKKKNVFLQHGVNGLKQVPGFHKKRGLLDYIIAPSQFEKDTITVPKWGYEPNEVAVTGYARWDSYEDKTAQMPFKQIFMMPTWRKWMDGMSRDQFVQTPFYHEYKAFLESPRLKQVLSENNVRLAFFLHPYFKDYVDLFDIDTSIIDRYGYLDVDMGEEIMKSSMMITDYSSVAWDMFYLKKPVAFYQFDRDDYLKTEGAYLDYERDLFGDATFDAEQTVAVIEKYVTNGFVEETQFVQKRDVMLNFVDHDNSKRIFEFLRDLSQK
jgi:CDP-glycerol glycerophosphotransferase (TagB/SpsB family)